MRVQARESFVLTCVRMWVGMYRHWRMQLWVGRCCRRFIKTFKTFAGTTARSSTGVLAFHGASSRHALTFTCVMPLCCPGAARLQPRSDKRVQQPKLREQSSFGLCEHPPCASELTTLLGWCCRYAECEAVLASELPSLKAAVSEAGYECCSVCCDTRNASCALTIARVSGLGHTMRVRSCCCWSVVSGTMPLRGGLCVALRDAWLVPVSWSC